MCIVASYCCLSEAMKLTCWQRISEREQVVQEYESSKAIPNQQVLTKLERALGKPPCLF
jgi:hypothetical protein